MKVQFDTEDEKQKNIDFHTKMVQYHQSQISKYINAPVSNTPDKPVQAHFESFALLWDKMPKKSDRVDAERKWKTLSKPQKKRLYEYVQRMNRGEWSGKDKKFVRSLSVIINKKSYLDEPDIERPVTMSEQPKPRVIPHPVMGETFSVSHEDGLKYLEGIKKAMVIKILD